MSNSNRAERIAVAENRLRAFAYVCLFFAALAFLAGAVTMAVLLLLPAACHVTYWIAKRS